MKRVILLAVLPVVILVCVLAAQRVVAQTSPSPGGGLESIVGFDVTREEGKDVYFSVLVREVVSGSLRVDVYDGTGTRRGEIRLKSNAVPEQPIRPD